MTTLHDDVLSLGRRVVLVRRSSAELGKKGILGQDGPEGMHTA